MRTLEDNLNKAIDMLLENNSDLILHNKNIDFNRIFFEFEKNNYKIKFSFHLKQFWKGFKKVYKIEVYAPKLKTMYRRISSVKSIHNAIKEKIEELYTNEITKQQIKNNKNLLLSYNIFKKFKVEFNPTCLKLTLKNISKDLEHYIILDNIKNITYENNIPNLKNIELSFFIRIENNDLELLDKISLLKETIKELDFFIKNYNSNLTLQI